ncbi:BRO family protein [Gordonia sp. (in: high G+C Gram-positive bacteria)]|uniref:BRO family protein n=1 Tax=Gordonia sp. (in: high G+C Gram-positive bacteria) TaxID=84139 RepID=UPI0033406037
MQDKRSSAPALFRYDDETAVRVITIDGEPWFVLNDLCRALGMARSASQVADRLDKGVRRAYPLQTAGGTQQATVVSEPGMYEVVLRSDKPEAVAFRRWLTGTVLPEIRRTGSFVAEQTPELAMAQGLMAAQQIIAAKDDRIAELEAPAKSWQLLADASGDFSVAEAAKILSRDPEITTGRDRLFAFMADQKWIFRVRSYRGGWEAYQTAVDTGRLVERAATPFLNSKTGEYELPAPTIRVTAKGIGKLHELMGGTAPVRFVTEAVSA